MTDILSRRRMLGALATTAPIVALVAAQTRGAEMPSALSRVVIDGQLVEFDQAAPIAVGDTVVAIDKGKWDGPGHLILVKVDVVRDPLEADGDSPAWPFHVGKLVDADKPDGGHWVYFPLGRVVTA